MIKCSANYCKSHNNFIIKGIKNKKTNIEHIQTIKIVKNIINRGAQTNMSSYLKSKYKYDVASDYGEYKLISLASLNWTNTIKGQESTLYNPALDFYENILEEYLKEYGFIKHLLLPEASINEIISNPKKEFDGMAVDFYLPQVDMVIEIDGIQHKAVKNKRIDEKRDKLLNQRVIRITTQELKARTSSLAGKMNMLKEILKSSNCINQYKKVIETKEINSEKVELIQIIRLQFVVLELLKNGVVDFNNNWSFKIVGVAEEIAKRAIQDILYWFDLIFKLQKIDVKLPKYYINELNNDNIVIDIDVLKRYDESCWDENIIYVRNDYFENNQKNYYEVECDKHIQYKLDYKNESDENTLKLILKNIFGHEDFREGQLQIITNILNRRETIGILPTGAGKSLCYQLASLLQPGITLVVCPIKSLLKDQKDNLANMYITNNAKIDSTMDEKEKVRTINNIKAGKYQIVLVAPERLQIKEFRESLLGINQKYNVSHGIIDEVHCMSEWGHQFRVSYLQLTSTMKKYMPSAVLVGLTATASGRVLKDLKIEFGITDESNIINAISFIRPELRVQVYNCEEQDKNGILYNIIDTLKNEENVFALNGKATKSGIIFTPFARGTRGCKQLSENLAIKYDEHKENIGFYCGKNELLSDTEKEKIQNEFKTNEKSWLCATNAFGMGIDKPNIRYIIHYGMAASIEALYQEMGRAGRDGKTAQCKIIHAKPQYASNQQEVLFMSTATNKEINYVLGKKAWNNGDVLDHFVLYTQNKDLNEIPNIVKIYKEYILDNSKFSISFGNNNLDSKQQALYKLSLLGIVKDWTVSYSAALIEGNANKLTNSQIEENIEKYINKYEYGFSLKNLDENRHKSIIQILNNEALKGIEKYISIVCTWYNENILYSRRQAIKNVDDLLSSLPNGKDCTEIFNKKIEDYFRPDDYNYLNTILLAKELDYISAIKTLYGNDNKVDLKRVEQIKTTLSRLQESYRNHPILNLLIGIVNIYLKMDMQIFAKDFEYALEDIQKNKNKKDIYIEILEVTMYMKHNQKAELNKYLLKYFNSLPELLQNYKYLKTQEVLNLVVNKEKVRMAKIEGGVINGFGKNG